jgi:hypothetical protein
VPSKLDIEKARPSDRYEKTAAAATSPQDQRPRPVRAASATPSQGLSQRSKGRTRREDAYPDELYDMYQAGNSQASQGRVKRQPPRHIEEVGDDAGSDYDDGSVDEGDFEMVSNRRPGSNSVSGSSGRGPSRRPDIRNVRVKVHAEDVRYIMIGVAIEFPDLVDRIRDKFGILRRFKIKVRDEDAPDGEMITVGDQDDLDMIIMTVKSQARKERLDHGKLEVSRPRTPRTS